MTSTIYRLLFSGLALVVVNGGPASADEPINLFEKSLQAFKEPVGDWQEVESVEMDQANPRRLLSKPGKGVWYNGVKGRARDLYTKEKYGDVDVSFEFFIPKGSNSGIKFHGVYEIQIEDSFGIKNPTGQHCGGVYPRADLKPPYKYLDKGIPPRVNACKPPGEWQSMAIQFQSPRFDAQGKKTANARVVKAVFNGQVIHESQELLTPTGSNWAKTEMAVGPLMLQGDHGPIAFRKVTVRTLKK